MGVKTCQWDYFLRYNFQPDAGTTNECPESGTQKVRFDNSDGSPRETIWLCQAHRTEAFKRGL